MLNSIKKCKLLDVYSLNELNRNDRQKKKYKITYNVEDMEHVAFFEKISSIISRRKFIVGST